MILVLPCLPGSSWPLGLRFENANGERRGKGRGARNQEKHCKCIVLSSFDFVVLEIQDIMNIKWNNKRYSM